ncbi:MAG: dihydroneopterin aldolase, partial [Bacteroidota bacterium]
NYAEAMFCISEAISNESYNLVETLAHEILSTILDKFPILVKATVRLRKMAVPMRRVVSHIEVEQTIERD